MLSTKYMHIYTYSQNSQSKILNKIALFHKMNIQTKAYENIHL